MVNDDENSSCDNNENNSSNNTNNNNDNDTNTTNNDQNANKLNTELLSQLRPVEHSSAGGTPDTTILFQNINHFEQDLKMASTKQPLSAGNSGIEPEGSTTALGDNVSAEGSTLNDNVNSDGAPNPACAVQMAKFKAEEQQRLTHSPEDQNDFVIQNYEVETTSTEVNSSPAVPSCSTDSNQLSQQQSQQQQPQPQQLQQQLQQQQQQQPQQQQQQQQGLPEIEVVSNSQEDNGETSLQSLLSQLQKENVKSAPGVGPSQDSLREHLKSLIKSGQIKIKFTTDPSSPKVCIISSLSLIL